MQDINICFFLPITICLKNLFCSQLTQTCDSNLRQFSSKIALLQECSSKNRLTIHQVKCKKLLFNTEANDALFIPHKIVPTNKHLGVIISNDFEWKSHNCYLRSKKNSFVQFLRRTVPFNVSRNLKVNLFETYVFSDVFQRAGLGRYD